jgi:3-methyladenine DNA glycosylase AlkC
LAVRFPDVAWNSLPAELERRGFWDAGMQQQVQIMARAAVEVLDEAQRIPALIDALAASPVEKVRGVSAFVVPLIYAGDLDAQIQALRFTGALEGTWPRELSATVLHNLAIEHGVSAVLARMGDWVADPDPAIRRLAVESLRPRGVMLAHIVELKQDPSPLKAHLERLLDDPSDYVRKAVANNLNDVSKDNPEVVLAWAQAWATPDASRERRWILARSLRTLVSEGHLTALQILGYAPASQIEVTWHDTTPRQVQINQLIPFEFELRNTGDSEALALLLLWMDAPGKGKGRRRKKYQIWKGRIEPGSARTVGKRIHFVDKSTQRKEPGTYRLIVTLNGEKIDEREMVFER